MLRGDEVGEIMKSSTFRAQKATRTGTLSRAGHIRKMVRGVRDEPSLNKNRPRANENKITNMLECARVL